MHLKTTALALAIAATPAPALAAYVQPSDISPTGYLRLTEISTSGAAFESWSATDLVGLHSRIQAEVVMPAAELRSRVAACEAAATPTGDGRLAGLVVQLGSATAGIGAAIDDALGHPERPAVRPLPNLIGMRSFSRLLENVHTELLRPRVRTTRYRLELRAELQDPQPAFPLFQGKHGAKSRSVLQNDEDATPVWVVERPEPISATLAASLRDALGLSGGAPWARALADLDQAIAHTGNTDRRNQLLALRAGVRAQLAQLRPVQVAARAVLDAPAPAGHEDAGPMPVMTTLDLDAVAGRHPGQHLVFDLVLTRDGEDVATLDERSLVLNRAGLYTAIKLGLDAYATPLYDPASTDPRRAGAMTYAPSVVFLAKWAYRTGFTDSNLGMFGSQKRLRGMMGGGAVIWNDVWDPGLGLHVGFPGLLTTHTPEPTVGLSVSIFKDLIHAGRGYDFATGQGYWFGGLAIPWSVTDLFGAY